MEQPPAHKLPTLTSPHPDTHTHTHTAPPCLVQQDGHGVHLLLQPAQHLAQPLCRVKAGRACRERCHAAALPKRVCATRADQPSAHKRLQAGTPTQHLLDVCHVRLHLRINRWLALHTQRAAHGMDTMAGRRHAERTRCQNQITSAVPAATVNTISGATQHGGLTQQANSDTACLLKLQAARGICLGILPGLGMSRWAVASCSGRLPPVHHLDGSLRSMETEVPG